MPICGRLLITILFAAASASGLDQPRDHFTANQFSTTFPVQIHGGLAYVPVEINGQRLQFVIDTGSSRTLVDTAQLKPLNLKVRETGDTVQGAGQGRVGVQAIEGVAVHLPGLDLYFDEASSVDLSAVTGGVGPTIDGVFGYPLLSRYVVTIDYKRETITITAPEKFVPPPGSKPLPLEFQNEWPFVAGELEPSEDVSLQDKFLIDSGSSDAVDHPIATKMQSRQPTQTGVGLGRPTQGSVAKLWGFKVGPYLIRGVEVACCGGTEDTMRLVGSGILSRFTVTFDYPHQQLFLVPNTSELSD